MTLSRRQLVISAIGISAFPLSTFAQASDTYIEVPDPTSIWTDPSIYFDQAVTFTGVLSKELAFPAGETAYGFDRHYLLRVGNVLQPHWTVIGVLENAPRFDQNDRVRIFGRLERFTIDLTLNDETIDGKYFRVDKIEAEMEQSSPSSTTGSGDAATGPVPQGGTLKLDGWEVEVTDAYVLPDAPGTSRLYFLLVELNIRNSTSEPRLFDGPDTDFGIKSEQGWAGNYDLFASAQIRVDQDQWTSAFTEGYDYPLTLVFSVLKHDPNLYQEGLSGWVLTISMDGDDHVIVVGDARDPGGIT